MASEQNGTVMAPLPDDDPLMVAWKRYVGGESYANTEKWARVEEHTKGSLWAAFVAGWQASMDARRD